MRRRVFFILFCLAVFSVFTVRCGSGAIPETVVVPSGDPAADGRDPYTTGGDFGCGGLSSRDSAVTLDPVDDGDGGTDVLVTCVGTRDVYLFLLTAGEFHTVAADLISFLPANGFASVGHAQVDGLTSSYCDSQGGADLGGELRALLVGALGADRVAQLQQGVCD